MPSPTAIAALHRLPWCQVRYFDDADDAASGEEPLIYECAADDVEHARAQAVDANPGCEIVSVTPFLELFVIHSAGETADEGAPMFWSNADGWVPDLVYATHFNAAERDEFPLPDSVGGDARWMPYREALSLIEPAGASAQAAH